MKLFLDDIRRPEDCIKYMYMRIGIKAHVYEEQGWYVVRNYQQFVDAMKEYGKQILLISFDHDLAHEHYIMALPAKVVTNPYQENTGYECALYAQQYYTGSLIHPEILIHSMNPVGVERIKSVFPHARSHH